MVRCLVLRAPGNRYDGLGESELRSLAKPDAVDPHYIDPSTFAIPQEVARGLPARAAHQLNALPVAFEGKTLVVAVEEPENLELEDKLRFICNREVRLVGAARVPLRYSIWRLYGPPSGSDSGS